MSLISYNSTIMDATAIKKLEESTRKVAERYRKEHEHTGSPCRIAIVGAGKSSHKVVDRVLATLPQLEDMLDTISIWDTDVSDFTPLYSMWQAEFATIYAQQPLALTLITGRSLDGDFTLATDAAKAAAKLNSMDIQGYFIVPGFHDPKHDYFVGTGMVSTLLGYYEVSQENRSRCLVRTYSARERHKWQYTMLLKALKAWMVRQ